MKFKTPRNPNPHTCIFLWLRYRHRIASFQIRRVKISSSPHTGKFWDRPWSYVPTCIPERPDFSQLGSSWLSLHQGTCRPSESRRKATRGSHFYPAMAADRKEAKYTQIVTFHHFVPLAFDTKGPVCAEGLGFISSFGHILSTMV